MRAPRRRHLSIPALLLGSCLLLAGCSATEAVKAFAPGCERYAEPVARGRLPEGLHEISGLASSSTPGVLWMHNDSGSKPILYAVDIESGALLARVTLDVPYAYDWEDMAAGPCGPDRAGRCLYVGDIGDGGARQLLGVPPRIYRFVEPDPARGDQTITELEVMLLRYPNGTPYNSEALVVDEQGRVFVLTKEPGDFFQLFGAPFAPGNGKTETELADYGTFDVSSMKEGVATKVTAADYDFETGHLLVRGWSGMLEYVLPHGRDLTTLQGITPRVVPVAEEPQGEAVTFGADGYFHVSEGAAATISFVGCAALETTGR